MAAIEAWQTQHLPLLHLLILIALLGLGFILPRVQASLAVLYTLLQMGLILLGTTLGYLHILPTLYLIVMIRSCFLFESWGRLVVAGLSFIFFAAHQAQYLLTILPMELSRDEMQRIWMHQFAEFLMFGLSLFLVSQLVTTLILERQTRNQLAMAHQKLQDYTINAEKLAAVQERNHIAREIHDSLGHVLTSLNIQLQTGLKLWQHDSEKAHQFLSQAQQLGKTAIQEVRQSVSTLRGDSKHSLALPKSIAILAEEFHRNTGIQAQLKIECNIPLSDELKHTLYRIIQEALTNIRKHAQATEVRVDLHPKENKIYLVIKDNGVGFFYDERNLFSTQPKPMSLASYGLKGMKERVEIHHGEFQVTTAPGQGCQVCIIIPYPILRDKPI